MSASDDQQPGPKCPACGEPWLRGTNLPGRYRCVYCLHRFELRSGRPNCGAPSTIATTAAPAGRAPPGPAAARGLYSPPRVELGSGGPNCGEHSTIARMPDTADVTCR